MEPRRSIFRAGAMKHYMERREKDVLPRIVTPPVFVVAWLILALLMLAGLLAWSAQIPTFTTASGIVARQGQLPAQPQNAAQAIVFMPPAVAAQIHVGQAIQVQIGTQGPQVNSTITQIRSGTISPADARTQFGLDAATSSVLTQPSTVVIVNLGRTISTTTFAGSAVSTQVQTGSQQVLSAL